MPKIRITLATVDAATVAAQPFGGKYLFKLGDSAAIVDPTTTDGTAQNDFDLPSDGTYAVSAQSLDVSGNPINDLISSSVTLSGGQIAPVAPPPPPATYPAPSALSAQIIAS